MTTLTPFITLSDADLLAEVTRLATCERRAAAQLVASLAELDARRLYLGRGFSSMFTYCVQALHLSEHAAYNRIEAARVARRFPTILDRLADGSITLTTVCLLAAHLTPENCDGVLDAAQYKTKREVEVLVAQLRPLPPVPSSVRKLPAVPVAARDPLPLSCHELQAHRCPSLSWPCRRLCFQPPMNLHRRHRARARQLWHRSHQSSTRSR